LATGQAQFIHRVEKAARCAQYAGFMRCGQAESRQIAAVISRSSSADVRGRWLFFAPAINASV
jgi:hypothetical protein